VFSEYLDKLIKSKSYGRQEDIAQAGVKATADDISLEDRNEQMEAQLAEKFSLQANLGRVLINKINASEFFTEIKAEKADFFGSFFRFIDTVLKIPVTYADRHKMKEELGGKLLPGEIFKQLGVSLDGVDLSKYDLKGANLSGLDLSSAILQGCNLSGAVLENVNLSRADLEGCNLSDVVMEHVNLYRAHLNKAIMKNIKADDVNFQNAYLRHADLEGAEIKNSNLVRASLYDSNLKDSRLTKIQVCETSMNRSDLRGAQFKDFHYNQLLKEQRYPQSLSLNDSALDEWTQLPQDLSHSLLGVLWPDNYNLQSHNLTHAKLGNLDNIQSPDQLPTDLNEVFILSPVINRLDLSQKNLDNSFIVAGCDARPASGKNIINIDHLPAKLVNVTFQEVNFDNQDLSKLSFDPSCKFYDCSFENTKFPDDFKCQLIDSYLGADNSLLKTMPVKDFLENCSDLDSFCGYVQNYFRGNPLGLIRSLNSLLVNNKLRSGGLGNILKNEHLSIINMLSEQALKDRPNLKAYVNFMESFLNREADNHIETSNVDTKLLGSLVQEGLSSEDADTRRSTLKTLSFLAQLDYTLIESIDGISSVDKSYIEKLKNISQNPNKRLVIHELTEGIDNGYSKIIQLAIKNLSTEEFDSFCDKFSLSLKVYGGKKIFNSPLTELAEEFEKEKNYNFKNFMDSLNQILEFNDIPRTTQMVKRKKYFTLSPDLVLKIVKGKETNAALSNQSMDDYAKTAAASKYQINSFAQSVYPPKRKEIMECLSSLDSLKIELGSMEKLNTDLKIFELSDNKEKLIDLKDSKLLSSFPELLEKLIEHGTGQHSGHSYPLMEHTLKAIIKANEDFKQLATMKGKLPYSGEDLEDLNIILLIHDLGKLTARDHGQDDYNSDHDKESIKLLELFSQRMGFNQLRKARLHSLFFAKETFSDINAKERSSHQAFLIGDIKTLELGYLAAKADSYAVHGSDQWFLDHVDEINKLKDRISYHTPPNKANAALFNVLDYPELIFKNSVTEERGGVPIARIDPDHSLLVHATREPHEFPLLTLVTGGVFNNTPIKDTPLLSTSTIHGGNYSNIGFTLLGITAGAIHSVSSTDMTSGCKKTISDNDAGGELRTFDLIKKFLYKNPDAVNYDGWVGLSDNEKVSFVEDLLIYHMTYKPEPIFGYAEAELHEFVSPKARRDFLSLGKDIRGALDSTHGYNEIVIKPGEVVSMVLLPGFDENEDALENALKYAKHFKVPVYILEPKPLPAAPAELVSLTGVLPTNVSSDEAMKTVSLPTLNRLVRGNPSASKEDHEKIYESLARLSDEDLFILSNAISNVIKKPSEVEVSSSVANFLKELTPELSLISIRRFKALVDTNIQVRKALGLNLINNNNLSTLMPAFPVSAFDEDEVTEKVDLLLDLNKRIDQMKGLGILGDQQAETLKKNMGAQAGKTTYLYRQKGSLNRLVYLAAEAKQRGESFGQEQVAKYIMAKDTVDPKIEEQQLGTLDRVKINEFIRSSSNIYVGQGTFYGIARLGGEILDKMLNQEDYLERVLEGMEKRGLKILISTK
jgi:uncharacterized protein YjbI with pentapeptide repeats